MDTSINLMKSFERLRYIDSRAQARFLKGVSKYVHLLTQENMKQLIHMLDITVDAHIELRILSLLAACITTEDHHYETIVTCTPIYDKMESILSRGLSLKSTVVLNFITLLVFSARSEEPSHRQLVVQAKNMVRVSGCLRALAMYFCSGMMFPDTWKALCQCLAECCQDSKLNQDYCSYLVPVCVQKCLQGYHDVIAMLYASIHDHAKNIELFLQSDGLQIFTRESLQSASILQVLSAVVQKSVEAATTLQNSAISRHISEILRWCGPHSQKGQWCTIIMYYINMCDKNKSMSMAKSTKTCLDENRLETTHSALEMSPSHGKDSFKDFDANRKEDHNNVNDTKELFRNVVKEILVWNAKEAKKSDESAQPFSFPCDVVHAAAQPPEARYIPEKNQPRLSNPVKNDNSVLTMYPEKYYPKQRNECRHQKTEDADLSFSFLINDLSSVPSPNTLQRKTSNQKKPVAQEPSRCIVSEKSCQTTQNITTSKVDTYTETEKGTISINDFMPAVTSTPKRRSEDMHAQRKTHLTKASVTKPTKTLSNAISKPNMRYYKRKKYLRPVEKKSPVQKLANRSMSSKIFEAVNESCTTLVRTMRDMFMPWKQKSESTASTLPVGGNNPRTESFMRYMRKRDAILGNSILVVDGHKHAGLNNAGTHSHCQTCDDTLALKEKLQHDDHLKETLKKLKMGINLYGCDFKKISKVMWPHESYMTPSILYNLYRKLILK